ncbi:MAG: membrane protein insertase YidC [Parvularculaceae bacterium]
MDRNVILFIALTALVIIGWDSLVLKPQQEAYRAQQQAAAEEAEKKAPSVVVPETASGTAPEELSIEDALAKAPGRIAIDTPSLVGSINLAGGRIDDLSLKNYRETLDPNSPIIRLLSPEHTAEGQYVEEGWIIAAGDAREQTSALNWSAPENAKLTPSTPVTLTARSGGFVYTKIISVDDKFMFTVNQSVKNETGVAARVLPYGIVVQRGIPEGAGRYSILQEGPIGVLGPQLIQRKYKKALTAKVEETGEKGWVGITNKYWLAAVAPPQDETFTIRMRNKGTDKEPVFQADYSLQERSLQPGATSHATTYAFAGAKKVSVLKGYEKALDKDGKYGIWDLDRSVDWGNLFFLTRPIFFLLDFFGTHIGNFGVAILVLTLVIKLLMFPFANKAFESMSRMKKVQPKVEDLKKQCGDDKVLLQKEMMALYQREKINPVAGCLPVIIQIPIFYALYKTLFVTIELRQQPFILWIKDLSAPDPTSIFNLFGLLPFDPSHVPLLSALPQIGVLPLIYGVVMWLQTQLNPPASDPTQRQVMLMMPFIFVFLFAGFASGLVLYWLWSGILSVAQQWYIMHRNGVEVHLAEKIPFIGGKKA